jgi:type 2A phosphatase activator TIP41
MKVLPEMLFGNNYLKLEHKDGFVLSFDAISALKEVNQKSAADLKVAYSSQWLERYDHTLR